MYRDEAKVSVFDSGFLLGDGIWEGLRLHKNRWTFFVDHMERFFEALKLVEINFNFSVIIGENTTFISFAPETFFSGIRS